MTEPRTTKRLSAIFASGKINLAAFERLTGVKAGKVKDVAREKSSFSEEDVVAIRKGLNQIRVQAKKHVDAFTRRGKFSEREFADFREFLSETPEIVIMKVFELKKLIDFRNGKQVLLTHSDLQRAVNKLAVFVLETAI